MIKIKLHVDPEAGGGVNFEKAYAAFFEGFAPYAFPIFNPEEGETTQIVHAEVPEPGEEKAARTVLIEGEDFEYTFSNHSVSGRIDTVRLVTLGDAFDEETQDLVLNEGVVTTATPVITVTGLDISNDAGVRGDVHEVVRGMMGGGHDVAEADPEPLTERLWAEGHRLTGTAGRDRYQGTDHDDHVRGQKGADRLGGGAGDDTLIGGKGKDTLIGGEGDDLFVFRSVAEIQNDRITDFSSGDRINLRGIDADAGRKGNQAFDFIDGDAFSGDGGEVRIVERAQKLVLQGDVDGDGRSDFKIVLAGVSDIDPGDILL